jgi:molybdopterin synthase catalytic subunit
MDARLHTALTDTPLSVSNAYDFAEDPAAGAVVVFTGTVRRETDGRQVTGLTYEAYQEQAEGQLADLAVEVARRWPQACAVWLEHRVGALAIAEPAVVVAVSAGHREQAFQAAAWAIDTLKSTVAIWKQEHWADGGAHWPGTD